MPEKPRPSPPVVTPLTVTVRCSGALHTLRWNRHGLCSANHRLTTLTLMTALDVPCRCALILAAVRRRDYDAAVLPRPLSQALRTYRDTRTECGHGASLPRADAHPLHFRLLQPAMTTLFQRLVRSLYAKGIDTTITVHLWKAEPKLPDWTAARAITVIPHQ
jgi:hypothetical protein